MRNFVLFLVFLLSTLLAVPAWGCPSITGLAPVPAMKRALDYYPTKKARASNHIALATCARQHFNDTREQHVAFQNEKSSDVYRYGRFLREIADIQNSAALQVRKTGGGQGIPFYQAEIEVRTALLKWCLGEKSACDVYKQLGALANAFEGAKQGVAFHDWMVENAPDSLVVSDVLQIWLKGVYSCPAWDFHPVQDGRLYTWKEACTKGCVAVARRAGEILKAHGPRVSSLQDQINALVKSTKSCEVEE